MNLHDLAVELFPMAQVRPEEGIEDSVKRMENLLAEFYKDTEIGIEALKDGIMEMRQERDAAQKKIGDLAHGNLKAQYVGAMQNRELKEIIAELLNAFHLTLSDCEHLHHDKKDYHKLGSDCPVSKRVQDAVDRATAALRGKEDAK